jgi:hypothetical protein
MFFLPLTAVVPADARTAVVARPFSTHQFPAPTLGGHHVHFCVVSLAELVAVPLRPAGARRISISDVTKREGRKGKTLFTFTVTLSAAYDQAVTKKRGGPNGPPIARPWRKTNVSLTLRKVNEE